MPKGKFERRTNLLIRRTHAEEKIINKLINSKEALTLSQLLIYTLNQRSMSIAQLGNLTRISSALLYRLLAEQGTLNFNSLLKLLNGLGCISLVVEFGEEKVYLMGGGSTQKDLAFKYYKKNPISPDETEEQWNYRFAVDTKNGVVFRSDGTIYFKKEG